MAVGVGLTQTINELLAEWDTPEQRALQEKSIAEYNAKPCKYGKWDRECWVHGYFPRRKCGHDNRCCDVPCVQCSRPLTGRQRTRARWRRQGRR